MDGTVVDLGKLSKREMELALHLHSGDLRGEICKAMGITSNTLQNYLNKIYLRLGIKTIAQLVLAVERAKAVAK